MFLNFSGTGPSGRRTAGAIKCFKGTVESTNIASPRSRPENHGGAIAAWHKTATAREKDCDHEAISLGGWGNRIYLALNHLVHGNAGCEQRRIAPSYVLAAEKRAFGDIIDGIRKIGRGKFW